jgi:hypothetical protein
MKIGDLVRYKSDRYNLGLGIVLGFDEQGDPLVHFQLVKGSKLGGVVYYSCNIKVVE